MARLRSKQNKEDSISNIQRQVEIVKILGQNGWDALVHQLGLLDIIPGGWKQKIKVLPGDLDDEMPLPVPRAFRKTLEDLGPTFIKLGQILSTRADLLPEEYINELKKLQQEVPAVPWTSIEPMILNEWNDKQNLIAKRMERSPLLADSVLDIFESFNTTPIASGSLGQAYEAIIKNPDKNSRNPLKDVIVKVRRPGIVPIIEADIAILKDLTKLVMRTRWGQAYNFMDMVNEFSTVLLNELDFTQEAYNTEAIGENLAKHYKKEVKTPEVYWKYCSHSFMTIELINGDNITLLFNSEIEEVLALQRKNNDRAITALDAERKKLAETITNVFLHQIFIDGFFHADPHPGNLLITMRDDRKGLELAIIDFGMVGRVDPRSRTILIEFLLAIIKFDAKRATDRIMEFGKAPPDIDRHMYSQELDHILRSTLGRPLKEVRVGKILQDIMDMTMKYRVQLPGIFVTLLRVLITTEGICRQLDRDYILIRAAEPFVVQAIRIQFLQHLSLRDLARLGLEVTNMLTSLPRQIDDLLVNLNSGRFEVIFKHRELQNLEHSLRVSGSRIAIGLMVCGLTISSAISLASPGPKILGLPLVTIGLFSISIILGLWLLNAINRRF